MIGRPITSTNRGGRKFMGAQENKQTAQDAYAAFGSGDAEGAMHSIDDSIEWVARVTTP
jgi:hypothetical protein